MKRLYLALAAALAILLAGVALARCSPTPTDQAGPIPAPPIQTSAATTSAAASQSVRVTIRRPADEAIASKASNGAENPQLTPQKAIAPYEEIVIEVAQDTTAAATAQASAELDKDIRNADAIQFVDNSVDNSHARIGVITATMPGILAADYQLARIDVPPWVLGTPLELGLDVAGNLEVGTLGVTAGGKAFAGAYYWTRWNLSDHGPALAVGLRF